MSTAKKKRKRSPWRVLGFLILVLLIGGSWMGYRLYRMVQAPNVQVPEDKAYFYIPTGSSFETVVQLLREGNYLLNENTFRWVAEKKNYLKNVKPGRYRLEANMSNNALVNLLRSGEQVPVQLTFNNVATLEMLAGSVGRKLEADSSAILAFLNSDSTQQHYGFSQRTFLAMFIPNTYEFYWNTDAPGFADRMAREFRAFWNEERKAKAQKIGLTQSEVATLASIVQAETRKRDEMPMVAGLYLNRLNRGMRLQADPTVKYAVGDPGLRRIYYKHLEVESPYNTYKHAGLPPGPIAMPERTALEAVLNPTKHNYIYMCARPDYSGYHNFARSHTEHERNRKKYQAFLRQEGIR